MKKTKIAGKAQKRIRTIKSLGPQWMSIALFVLVAVIIVGALFAYFQDNSQSRAGSVCQIAGQYCAKTTECCTGFMCDLGQYRCVPLPMDGN